MTPLEWGGLVLVFMVLLGVLAGRRDKKKPAQEWCARCGWPRSGPLPCLCAEGTEGRYEGDRK